MHAETERIVHFNRGPRGCTRADRLILEPCCVLMALLTVRESMPMTLPQ
jgi:hypothetical protein